MLRKIGFPFIALLAFAAAGCSGGSSTSSPDGSASDVPGSSSSSGVPSDPHPAWLVGTLAASDVVDDKGVSTDWWVHVRADGTATTGTTTFAYGSSTPVTASTDTTWTVTGDTIQIGADAFGLEVAASCNVVELVDGVSNRTYEIQRGNGGTPRCPYAPRQLNEAETKLAKVRYWTAGSVLLAFHDTGELWFSDTNDSAEHTMLFSVDDAGTMHWSLPDGTDLFSGTFALSGESFEFCPTGGKCITWEDGN